MSMSIILIIVAVVFVIGLLTRSKGDGMLDTLSSGCGNFISIIFGIIIFAALVLWAYNNGWIPK